MRHPRLKLFLLTSVVAGATASALAAAGGDAGAPAPAVDAGPGGQREGGPMSRIPPDPPALSERHQWIFDLRWDRGDVFLLGVHKTDMGERHVTPRVMGRFALELYEGNTLIERVRFDFPMLGSGDLVDAGFNAPPRFEPKLKTRIGVMFPATSRGTKLELWDRARDQRFKLPWPPKEGLVVPPEAGVR